MRLPILPTILVAAAVATMIALGVWQLGRAEEKAAMLARYERAVTMSSAVPYPRSEAEFDRALYRHSSVICDRVLSRRTAPGRNFEGRQGLAQMVRCTRDGGGEVEIALGWSLAPTPADWSGGEVFGFVAPAGRGVKLVAAPPVAGLEPLAHPDPRALPNNHIAYAWQWFFFAATALVIYLIALRRRQRDIGVKS